eukprot:scaffold34378_cov129-Isochrysis_galbana.AAC.3
MCSLLKVVGIGESVVSVSGLFRCRWPMAAWLDVRGGDKERVEIGEIVVDPLLPKLLVISEIARQPLEGVKSARLANVGIARGVAHRSAVGV